MKLGVYNRKDTFVANIEAFFKFQMSGNVAARMGRILRNSPLIIEFLKE